MVTPQKWLSLKIQVYGGTSPAGFRPARASDRRVCSSPRGRPEGCRARCQTTHGVRLWSGENENWDVKLPCIA